MLNCRCNTWTVVFKSSAQLLLSWYSILLLQSSWVVLLLNCCFHSDLLRLHLSIHALLQQYRGFNREIKTPLARFYLILRQEIVWRNAPRFWRDFESALSFQTRLTQTKPVVPQSNEHGSQAKDQGWRQCCHKHKKFPYLPTLDESLLAGHVSYRCQFVYYYYYHHHHHHHHHCNLHFINLVFILPNYYWPILLKQLKCNEQ
jgi:hypothetical protein